MKDLYLKFADRNEAVSAFEVIGAVYDCDVEAEDGTVTVEKRISSGSHSFAIWEVGIIDEVDGWHVNLRVIDEAFDVSSLEVFCVHPAAPVCVWA
jgi:hypothetical protein